MSNSTPDTLLTHSATLDLLQYTEGHTVHGEYTDEVWESFEPFEKIYARIHDGRGGSIEMYEKDLIELLNGISQCTVDATFWES